MKYIYYITNRVLLLLFTAILCPILDANAQTPDASGIVYVTPGGSGNGSSWGSATGDLQAAIDATGVTKVFVAIGNYPAPANSFVMKNNVAIYGGFDPANNITTLAHNRILPTATVGGSVLNGENARRVINNYNGTDLNNTAILDGFTIANGYSDNATGAGILNFWSSPAFYNLVIKENSALSGGGVANLYSSASFTNIVISNNIAQNYTGGGMNNSNSSPVLTNVTFSNNRAYQQGAAIQFANSSPTLTNVKITNNTTDNPNGSVIFFESIGNGTTTLNNVTIANNTNSIVAINLNNSPHVLNIRNSIVYGGISNGTFSSAQYSLIEGNNSTANNNLNASLYTLNDVFTNSSGGDYTLKTGSPAIDAGSNALYPGLNANTQDLAGNTRFMGAAIDLGVYETFAITADIASGIIYVKPNATGTATGNSWANATSDLHNAIHTSGVTKVFVATGNYNVGSSSFIMKNGVAIYGGFNPSSGITDLSHNRILPTESTTGSVLNGENTRPLIWNNDNGLNNTAILDGFTLMNGSGIHGGAIYNLNVAPVFNNLVIKNNAATASGGAIYNVNSSIKLNNSIITNNTAQYGGGVRNNGSASEFTNVTIKNNTATLATSGAGGGGIFNENSALKLTNVLIANNGTYFQGGGLRSLSGNPVLTNVTIASNLASVNYSAMEIAGGNPQINNSIILGTNAGTYIPKYSMIVGNVDMSNGNIPAYAAGDVFTSPAGANFTLKIGSNAINAGSNALFTNLDVNTKDLAGKARVYKYANGGVIDMGAYESEYSLVVPDANDIVYVTPSGSGNGSSWANATSDLHTAIQTMGVSKVFVAKGTYNVGTNSFVMKNGVEIYGGFDPSAGISDLTHNRIMPNASNTNGSILNGEGLRPVIWNVFTSGTAMNNTAILDGFTIFNGSYSNGAGIRNVYASPTLRNLVIRGNAATSTGAGIYNENSNPDIYNTVISGNAVIAPFSQSGMGAGIYNGTNSAPTIVNTTIVNNTITGIGANPTMIGAGVANLNSAAPKIYNSIIWNNQKNGVANTSGADIENNSATLTLKNSITQVYSTGNSGDNNKVGSNPLFFGTDFKVQGNSPAFNAGSNILFSGLNANTKDLAGHPRVSGSTIDIGAYEYTLLPDINGVIYVREGYTGLGTSWADATGDLHNAIHATNVQKVFVASGNYNVGDHSFIMKNNVEIYGGFDPANGITDLSHNRIMPNAANTNGSVLNGQNIRPVVWNEYSVQNQLYSTAVLDGFTIMNGLNTGLKGAGIYNFGASPTLRNLVLRNNVLTSWGAALYNVGSNTVVTNVSIINNTGRGVVNSESSPQFTNVLISGNTGTGVYNWGNTYSHVGTYTNVTIANNGLPFEAGAYSHFKNSILWDDINNYSYGGENNLIKGNVSTANGNLNTLLMAPSGIFTDYANGDYTLVSGSPAIDMGSNALFTGLTGSTKDLAGNARVYDFANGGIIDMGAYEAHCTPIDYSNVTFTNAAFTYDSNPHSIAVQNLPVGASVSYEITDTASQTTTGNTATNAGVYTIKATLSPIPTGTFCNTTFEITATLTINKAAAVITATTTQTHVYDGDVKNVVATLNHSETLLIYTPQQGYTNVGTYPVTVSAIETDNYLATYETVNLVINNADFTGITFNDGAFTYDGTAKSIFVSGAPVGATVTYTITDAQNNTQSGNSAVSIGVYVVTASISMANYNDMELEAILTIDEGLDVSVPDEEKDIFVFPNPFNDIIKVSKIENVKSISIYDMSGRLITSLASTAELNLSNLSQGSYMLVLHMENNYSESFKILKK